MTKTDPLQAMQPVPLPKAYLLLNHGPVTLVSSAHQGQRNVMAASWAMPLDFNPPKVAVVIDRQTLTRELVEASGELVLNIPCQGMAPQVLAVGTHSGRDTDKWLDLDTLHPADAMVQAPYVAGCVAWLACKVIPEPHNQQRYDLFIAEVVGAWADPAAFQQGRWAFSEDEHRTLHYSAGGQFYVTGEGLKPDA